MTRSGTARRPGIPGTTTLGVIFNGDHNDLCIDLTDTEFRTKGSIMKILQSPEKQNEFENLAITCLSDWGSSSSNVSQILEKEIMKKSCPSNKNPNTPPPPSYLKSILIGAK